MKRIIYRILLISLFITAIFTIKSYGASDFTYTLDSSGSATITAYKGSESNLTIPSTIDGHNVITIGSHAFDESRNSTNGHTIKNVVISEGIKRIELLAFAKCTNLETVKLPESLTFIDMQTFIQCSKLKSINIPSKIDNIANSTFQETGFTEFDIPENVKSIANRALGICSNLKKVRVYSKDINFESGVFEYGSSNLILYGYEGSTTQTYAQQNGLEFKLLSDNEEDKDIAITSITLNKSSLTLTKENSETLIATILPNNATNKTLNWSSSNPNVAIVENGKITAKSVGTATITVSNSDGTKKATCNVEVSDKDDASSNILIDSITLNKSLLTLTEGNSETLIATVLPNNATNKTLVWSSSNSNVAIVENGKITAKSVGTATITVSNSDGTKKATCNINVLAKKSDSEKKEDNTVVKGKLPQTGMSNTLLIIFVSALVITIISYKQYKKFKNI